MPDVGDNEESASRERVTSAGTRYSECRDYPRVCAEYPAPCRGATAGTASFRKIADAPDSSPGSQMIAK
jgi:hypothetical protein